MIYKTLIHGLTNRKDNPDTNKQAQGIIFSRKIKVTAHPQIAFNNNPVHETLSQKHQTFLCLKLNFQENFENMLNETINKVTINNVNNYK